MKNLVLVELILFFVGLDLVLYTNDVTQFHWLLLLLPIGPCIYISHKFGNLCKNLEGKYWIGFFGGPISAIYYIGKKISKI